MGVYWAKFMPNTSFNFFGRKIELNPPCPFNQKGSSHLVEHGISDELT
jgi:hypothetical protein